MALLRISYVVFFRLIFKFLSDNALIRPHFQACPIIEHHRVVKRRAVSIVVQVLKVLVMDHCRVQPSSSQAIRPLFMTITFAQVITMFLVSIVVINKYTRCFVYSKRATRTVSFNLYIPLQWLECYHSTTNQIVYYRLLLIDITFTLCFMLRKSRSRSFRSKQDRSQNLVLLIIDVSYKKLQLNNNNMRQFVSRLVFEHFHKKKLCSMNWSPFDKSIVIN